MDFFDKFPRSQGETLAHEGRKMREERRSKYFMELFESGCDLSF
jgi:hypothetical protein